MPIQDNINDLNSLIQNEFTGVTAANKISADDVKNLAQKTVAIATEAGAKFAQNDANDAQQTTQLIENQAVDAAQTAKDVEHDLTNATQNAEIVALKVVKKQAANVFYVDRRYTNTSELIAQEATALQGSMEKPFATPFGAKKSAIAFLSLNPTKQAIIEIAKGNTYTSADYVASEHDVTVSMGGIDYVSGVELAFHGITYFASATVTIETPMLGNTILTAMPNTKCSFIGGNYTKLGWLSVDTCDIAVDIDSLPIALNESHYNRVIDFGIKFFRVGFLTGKGVCLGDKWGGVEKTLDATHKSTISYHVKRYDNPASGHTTPIFIPKSHNKTIHATIESMGVYHSLLSLGNGSGVNCADGLPSGMNHSHAEIAFLGFDKNGYIYPQQGGLLIALQNNRFSTASVSLADLETTIPKILHAYGIQEGNRYCFAGKSLKINNPASTELPFGLALDTSELILEGFDIESNVNAPLFTVTSGKLILRNCKIKQTAAGQPVFSVATGATVLLENCHLIHSDRLTPLSIGAGRIVSKKSTSNVAIGTAVLRGDLSVSKWYDESLNQSDFVYTSISFEGEFIIPNPLSLRIEIKDKGVLAPFQNSTFEMAQGSIYVENRTSDVSISAGNLMTIEYALIPTDYILGA